RGLSDNVTERFCNDVAGEFLLPQGTVAVPNAFPRLPVEDVQLALRETDRVAQEWNVSQGVVTYYFIRNNWIAPNVGSRLFTIFAERWHMAKRRAKETRDSGEAGPSYYVVRRNRLGAALLGVV